MPLAEEHPCEASIVLGMMAPHSRRATAAPAAVGPPDEGVDVRPAALAAHDATVVQADDGHVLGVGQRMHHSPKGQLVPLPHGLQPVHTLLKTSSKFSCSCCRLLILIRLTSWESKLSASHEATPEGVRARSLLCDASDLVPTKTVCCCHSPCTLSDPNNEAADASRAAPSPAEGRRAHLLAGDSIDGEAHEARVAIACLEGRRGLPGRLCVFPCGPRIVSWIHHGIVLTWRPRAQRHGLKSIQDSLHSPCTPHHALHLNLQSQGQQHARALLLGRKNRGVSVAGHAAWVNQKWSIMACMCCVRMCRQSVGANFAFYYTSRTWDIELALYSSLQRHYRLSKGCISEKA